MNLPAFERRREGQVATLVRRDLRATLLPVLRAAARGEPIPESHRLPGGRGSSFRVDLPSGRFVVRAGRRGGLPGRLLTAVYAGFEPRPFRELEATAALRARGAPVAEPCGAAALWLLPGLYRGWLVTRWVDASRTLWEWAQTNPTGEPRDAGLAAVGIAVARLHGAGALHPDLNANNILLTGTPPEVVLVDLDGVHLGTRVAGDTPSDLVRLRRSARKLDPRGCILGDTDLDRIAAAYAEHRAAAISAP